MRRKAPGVKPAPAGITARELIDKILYGHGYVGNDIPLGKANRYLDETIPQREYDPDKVKHHLKKAGHSELNIDLSAAEADSFRCLQTSCSPETKSSDTATRTESACPTIAL